LSIRYFPIVREGKWTESSEMADKFNAIEPEAHIHYWIMIIFLTSYIQHVVCVYNCMLIFSVIERFLVNLRSMRGSFTCDIGV